MTNKQSLVQNYAMKAVKIVVFVLAVFLMNTTANAQTALEQQCYNDVQGKVAWNQAGTKTWGDANLRRLCRETTNPSATIACFQAQIKQHNDWDRGITACLPEQTATKLTTKIVEDKTAVPPSEPETVRTLTFKNNASIQATLTVGSTSSGQLNIGESKTVNIKESIGTPLQVAVTMRIPNPDLFVIYRGVISDDNRATSFCFEAKGDVAKPSVQPCNGTQATEMRKIEFRNEAGFITKSTLNYFVNGSPRAISTDETSLGMNRVIYIPIDADKDKDITLSTSFVTLSSRRQNLPDIWIDRNSRSSLCYKVWGSFAVPKFNPCSLSQSARTIKFKNNGAFNAILTAVFDSPNRVVSNPTGLLESDVQEIPRIITAKPIEVFIEFDNANSWKRFFTTTVASNFTGELCFKAEGTAFNPTASTCDDTIGDASGDTRQIKFQNDGAYDAQALVMYFEYQTIGGTKVSMPKTITTGFINLGKNRMITVPKDVVPGTTITIILQGNATVKNDIWSTTLPADFKGSPVPCFKVWGSLFDPKGGKCNQ